MKALSQFYEGEVASYLVANDPSQTVADVAYDGPIDQQVISALPTAPPWKIQSQSTPNPAPTSIPGNLIAQVQISVAIQQTGMVTGDSYSGGVTTLTVSSSVSTSGRALRSFSTARPREANSSPSSPSTRAAKTITVSGNTGSYTGQFSIVGLTSLQSIPNISLEQISVGYSTSDPLKPRLFINGGDVADSSIDAIAGDNIDLVIQVMPGNTGGCEWGVTPHVFTRAEGDYMAIGLDAGQMSNQLLVAARNVVNTADILKANGGSPSNDAITGGLLNLAVIDYFLNCDKDDKSLAGLTSALPLYNSVAFGIATANSAGLWNTMSEFVSNADINGVENLQIPYLPPSMVIDVPSGNWHSSSIDETAVTYGTEGASYMPEDIAHSTLMGYDSSSWEALVWEDLTNTPTICTVKSLQMAYQPNSGMTVETFAKQATVPTGSAIAVSTETALAGYLPNLSSGICTDIWNYLSVGDSVTVPTNYTTLGAGTATEWQGVGFVVRNANGMVIGNIIANVNGASHGGYTGGDPDTVPAATTPPDELANAYTTKSASAGDPIEINNGNVTYTETDFSIPNLGSPLEMVRQYDSSNTVAAEQAEWSDCGTGCSDTLTAFNPIIDGNQPTNTLVWVTDTGTRFLFTPNGSGYNTPASLSGTLTPVGASMQVAGNVIDTSYPVGSTTTTLLSVVCTTWNFRVGESLFFNGTGQGFTITGVGICMSEVNGYVGLIAVSGNVIGYTGSVSIASPPTGWLWTDTMGDKVQFNASGGLPTLSPPRLELLWFHPLSRCSPRRQTMGAIRKACWP